jgi:hypothetical protein
VRSQRSRLKRLEASLGGGGHCRCVAPIRIVHAGEEREEAVRDGRCTACGLPARRGEVRLVVVNARRAEGNP